MKGVMVIGGLVLAGVMSVVAQGETGLKGTLPMPPTLADGQDVEQILESYPLGVIPRQAAFIHHGPAHRTVTLPNGLEGWVYEISAGKMSVDYVMPSGAVKQVDELDKSLVHASYTLVFDPDGVIRDVLYTTTNQVKQSSALLVQQKHKGVTERPAWRPGQSSDR